MAEFMTEQIQETKALQLELTERTEVIAQLVNIRKNASQLSEAIAETIAFEKFKAKSAVSQELNDAGKPKHTNELMREIATTELLNANKFYQEQLIRQRDEHIKLDNVRNEIEQAEYRLKCTIGKLNSQCAILQILSAQKQ